MTHTSAGNETRAIIEALQVKAGEPGEDYGQTTVSVERSGRFVVEQEGGHEEVVGKSRVGDRGEPISGDVRELIGRSPEELFGLAETIVWDRAFPPRAGIPDEAVLEWRVQTAEGLKTTKMWLRDAERDEQVAPLLGLLRSVVGKATEDRLFL